jgi:hypothetical protein
MHFNTTEKEPVGKYRVKAQYQNLSEYKKHRREAIV